MKVRPEISLDRRPDMAESPYQFRMAVTPRDERGKHVVLFVTADEDGQVEHKDFAAQLIAVGEALLNFNAEDRNEA